LDRDLCGRLGFGACRSPGQRLLPCFLSDRLSFSNRLSAPCRLADGRFLAFRPGSSFCRHGCLPGAHCIWKVFVRSLPNTKVSQQVRRRSWGYRALLRNPGTGTAMSEIPLPSSLAALINWSSEAWTNALEAVSKAFFSHCHHSRACPSRMTYCAEIQSLEWSV